MSILFNEIDELSILRSAVENTNEAFITINGDHTVLFVNRAAENIFGYGRDEVVGNDLDVIMAPECSENHRQAVRRYERTRIPGRIGHDTEMVATRKNGDTFPASISFSVSEVEGKLYFTGLVRDLTERKALQERILRSERLAALGRVVAEITHEIKNPLMMIGGFARQLIDKSRDEEELKKLNIIIDEVFRLEKLIKELRDFYTPRSLGSDQVDLNVLLREVVSLVQDDCESKKININLELSPVPAVVKGDRDRLKEVFLNLVKNAMESIKGAGNLEIRTELFGGRIDVIVSDDGPGIPEGDREKIFSPFFTTKSNGTGLGLSVSKRIIEEHDGGSLTLQSHEGKGTVFRVSLPAFDNSFYRHRREAEGKKNKV